MAHDLAVTSAMPSAFPPSTNARSVTDELAAKKDRMMQKLRYDEVQNHHGAKRDKKRKKVEPPLVEVYRETGEKNSRHRKLKKEDKKSGKKHVCTSACFGTTDEESDGAYTDQDEIEEDAERKRSKKSRMSEDEVINKQPSPTPSDQKVIVSNNNGSLEGSSSVKGRKLKVRYWNKGQDNFMELNVYRRRLLNTNSVESRKSSTSSGVGTSEKMVSKELRLEKVGKRIRQLVTTDDDSEPEEVVLETKVHKEAEKVVEPRMQAAPPSKPNLPKMYVFQLHILLPFMIHFQKKKPKYYSILQSKVATISRKSGRESALTPAINSFKNETLFIRTSLFQHTRVSTEKLSKLCL